MDMGGEDTGRRGKLHRLHRVNHAPFQRLVRTRRRRPRAPEGRQENADNFQVCVDREHADDRDDVVLVKDHHEQGDPKYNREDEVRRRNPKERLQAGCIRSCMCNQDVRRDLSKNVSGRTASTASRDVGIRHRSLECAALVQTKEEQGRGNSDSAGSQSVTTQVDTDERALTCRKTAPRTVRPSQKVYARPLLHRPRGYLTRASHPGPS